jgi:hypothetical protein
MHVPFVSLPEATSHRYVVTTTFYWSTVVVVARNMPPTLQHNRPVGLGSRQGDN